MIESLESRGLYSSLFYEAGSYRTGLVSRIATGDFDGNGTIDIAANNG